jgi:uncharacterized repeat protein (TIGR03803 family)
VFSMSLDGREQVLHAFGAAKDGALPAASLLQWNDALYGTTGAGGTNGCGTVFRVSANGQVETIHRFQNTPDACTSQAKLVESNGKLYGTSVGGGKNGWGTVFEITPSGAERVLLSFSANPSGYGPSPNGLVALNGNLYGTTASSDPNGGGTIFELTPSNTETILHNFGRGRDGSSPRASMTVVGNTLFGTTASGGAYHDGTVFQLQL